MLGVARKSPYANPKRLCWYIDGFWMSDLRDQLQKARLSATPFPPYRFVPGRNPHPTAHPEGHSYHPPGEPQEEVPWVAPEHWRQSDAYRYGCDLHNHAYWWEAHEAWEGLWQVCDKKASQGLFLQGLIQVAAAHLKLYVGHERGVARLHSSAVGYLDRVIAAESLRGGDLFMGLDLVRFRAAVGRYYAERCRDGEPLGGHDVEAYPYVQLSDA